MANRKFRFYITDLFNGCISGTDSEEDANNFASCEDYFVVDTKTGKQLVSSGEERDVEEISSFGGEE